TPSPRTPGATCTWGTSSASGRRSSCPRSRSLPRLAGLPVPATMASSQQRMEPMKDDFVSLFAYNRWADDRVLDACRKLTPEQYAAEPAPGWSSVRSSIVHIAIVTEGWLGGLAGEPAQDTPTEADLPTVDD